MLKPPSCYSTCNVRNNLNSSYINMTSWQWISCPLPVDMSYICVTSDWNAGLHIFSRLLPFLFTKWDLVNATLLPLYISICVQLASISRQLLPLLVMPLWGKMCALVNDGIPEHSLNTSTLSLLNKSCQFARRWCLFFHTIYTRGRVITFLLV